MLASATAATAVKARDPVTINFTHNQFPLLSTYETTAGLGDERVRILPRRGLVKNHYYTRATHGIVEVMWSNRGAFVEKLSLAKPSQTIGDLI